MQAGRDHLGRDLRSFLGFLRRPCLKLNFLSFKSKTQFGFVSKVGQSRLKRAELNACLREVKKPVCHAYNPPFFLLTVSDFQMPGDMLETHDRVNSIFGQAATLL